MGRLLLVRRGLAFRAAVLLSAALACACSSTATRPPGQAQPDPAEICTHSVPADPAEVVPAPNPVPLRLFEPPLRYAISQGAVLTVDAGNRRNEMTHVVACDPTVLKVVSNTPGHAQLVAQQQGTSLVAALLPPHGNTNSGYATAIIVVR